MSDDPMHPRPQLTRPGWVDLCGTWQFAYDDADEGVEAGWHDRDDVFDRQIVVPFPPESPASGIGETGFHPVVWYRRTFAVDLEPGHRLLLHFGAVDYRAQVWVNGRSAIEHEGGHTPFSIDLTSAVAGSGEQVVVVRAEDPPADLQQPRGKQDWEEHAHAIWYDRTTGIWQPVWLEQVPSTYVTGLRWLPDVDRLSIGFSVSVARPTPGLRARVVLRQHDEVLADDVYTVTGGKVDRVITLHETGMSLGHSPVLWSPESPNLIDATVTLLDEEGTALDEVGSYTALRSISTSRRRVLLNGRPYYLRLVLAQGFWPQTHLAAPDEQALRREVELAKQLGFNGMRLHQKIEDPRLLAWCDRIGMLVWAEMPATYEFSTTAISRLTREWLEVLQRDSNHPCIVAWVPFNESWGVPALSRSDEQRDLVRTLYHLTRAMDPTRLVIGNDGWEQLETDLLTVHDYTSSGQVLRQRYGSRRALDTTLQEIQPAYHDVVLGEPGSAVQPVLISEFGGISLDAGRDESWRGYGGVDSPERLLAGYGDLVGALIDSPAIAGFCWTQLTDVQQERNGLLTADRASKVDPAQVQAITTRASAAVPGDAIGEFAYGDYAPGAVPPGPPA